jgi:DNA repair exonuclease SbcCD ATPase subunit
MEGTLESLLKERDELVARLDALDADIRAAKERRRQELLRELEALGLSDGRTGRRPGTRTRESARARKKQACRVCGFTTAPPHDARSHRHQKTNRPFSDAELAEKKLVRA